MDFTRSTSWTLAAAGLSALVLSMALVSCQAEAPPDGEAIAEAGTAPKRFVREERLAAPAEKAVGDLVTVEIFETGDMVDVIGTTKGRGFAGTIKRHGFSRGPETHGSMNVRRPGSIGSSAYPGKVAKGKKMSGHYGAKRHTTKNLQIVRIDNERGLLFIRGAVPGPTGGFIQVQAAKTALKKG